MQEVEINNKLKEKMMHSILSDYIKDEISQEDFNQYLAKINELFDQDDIAIIGISCQLPDALDHVQFWENLMNRKESIKRFPQNRLEDFYRAYDSHEASEQGGYLDEIDQFDADYFQIPPKTAVEMDPYHKKMLEVIVKCIEDAGYYKEQLFNTKTGVFIGHDHTKQLLENYFHFIPEEEITFPTILGSTTGILASRISHLFNLKGPAVVLDTACTSAMLALDTAINSIAKGDCEAALVGGISLSFGSAHRTEAALSSENQIRAFDNEAGGTMWSEGAACVYIKSLSKAIAGKDHIYGVIKSIALNNDGVTSSLTAPNKDAQKEVILQAWEKRGINPEDISYIEAHGTGTIIGDPIEIAGLTEAFRVHTNKKQFCGIGSVKSNVGHTAGLSGLTSLIKILMSFERGIIPPTTNFREPNQLVDFLNSPLYVQKNELKWTEIAKEILVGISAFSFTGTNSHMVLKSYPAERSKNDFHELIFPLSAKNDNLMIKTIEQLIKYLQAGDYQLEDVSYTMSCCRNHQDFRVAIITNNIENLIDALTFFKLSLYQGKEKPLVPADAPYRIYYDSKHQNALEYAQQSLLKNMNGQTELTDFSLDLLALKYAKNSDVAFDTVFKGMNVSKCSLPPVEFDRKRYWESRPVKKITIPQRAETGKEEKAEIATSIDELVKRSWSEAFGYENINPDDNFFELGGDSISGFKITGYLSEALQLEIPNMGILNNPVFTDYVAYINSLQPTDHVAVPEVVEVEVNSEINLPSEQVIIRQNSAQRGIYLISQMMNDGIDDHVVAIIPSDQLYSVERISDVENAVRQLIERHAALRTSFYLQDDEFVQEIHQQVNANVELFHLSSEATVVEETLINKVRELRQPFNLEQPPLFRVYNIVINGTHHFIVFDIHHIITDGVATGILIHEFSNILDKKTLPETTDNYGQIMQRIYEREATNSQIHLDWWLDQFKDGVPELSIITDRPRPTIQNYHGFRVKSQLDKQAVDQLKALASHTGSTLYMVLLGGLYELICNLTNETDHVIGTLSANRNTPEEWGTVGMFVRTLPLRINLDQSASVANSFSHLKQLVTESFSHQDIDYEMLLEKLNVGGSPLFDVYFALQNIDMGIDLASEFIEPDVVSTKFNIMVVAREEKGSLVIDWDCRSDLFDPTTIERFAARYIKLLEGMALDVDCLLGDLEYLPEAEKSLILGTFNNTQQEYPKEKTVVHLFEEQVEKTPDAIAVAFEDESITYDELNARANILAYKLRLLGVGADDYVGIITEKSIDMIVGLCGIVKAGAAYVPLDPTYPPERIDFIIKDCQPKVLLVGNEKFTLDVNVPVVEIKEGNIFTIDFGNLEIVNQPNDLIYLIYTSGTTGKPKGVMVEHKNVVSLVKNTNYVDFNNISLAQGGSLSFDAATFEIWGALLNGGKVVVIKNDVLLNYKDLEKSINEHEINTMWLTSSVFNQIVQGDPNVFSGLSALLIGGEALSDKHVRSFKEHNQETRLINGYGPTENTTFSTTYEIPADFERLPIGRPLSNRGAYILNNNKLQGIGVPGELCVAGDGVARGYLNRLDLTDEKFIPSPFGEGKLYRTGDLARWLPDGNIEYLGRIDDQVKIRGYRIELGEIENVLRKTEDIEDGAVIVREDENGEKAIYAYFTAKDELNVNSLQTRLRQQLPDYMIPSHMKQIDQIPLTPNGKLNRKLLPDIENESAAEYVPPQNELEIALINIWEGALGRENIGIHDNFFDLGGHSLKAMTIVNKISSDLGYNIPVAELYNAPDVSQLANYISTEGDNANNIDGLVLLKKGKQPEKNFFIVHAGSGKAMAFMKLANNINDEFNCWGFEYERLDPDIPAIEILASSYIDKLQQVQEVGPYYISGWCVGGLIAFEIARQLEKQGAEVKFLGLYNTTMTIPNHRLKQVSIEPKYPIANELGLLQHIFPEYNIPEAVSNITTAEELWQFVAQDLENSPHYEQYRENVYNQVCTLHPDTKRVFDDPEKIVITDILQFLNLGRGFGDVDYTYHNDQIKSKINYFIATKEKASNLELWSDYSVQKVDYYNINADHFSMFQTDEGAQELADTLNKLLYEPVAPNLDPTTPNNGKRTAKIYEFIPDGMPG